MSLIKTINYKGYTARVFGTKHDDTVRISISGPLNYFKKFDLPIRVSASNFLIDHIENMIRVSCQMRDDFYTRNVAHFQSDYIH